MAAKIKIKFVSLEPEAFLSDDDVQSWTAEEIGAYWMLILYLYANNGACEFDEKKLAALSHCPSKHFSKVWLKISKKFQIKAGKIPKIKHKRVSKALRRARKRVQDARRAGLISGERRRKTMNGRSTAAQQPLNHNGSTKRKRSESESEAKRMNNTKRKNIVSSNEEQPKPSASSNSQPASSISFREAIPIQKAALFFNETLRQIIRPKNQSDRTAFNNLTNWLVDEINRGRYSDEIFDEVIEYAKEATKRPYKNAAAKFFDILRRQMGYKRQR